MFECGGISCRSTTVGTCRTILTRPRFVPHVVLLDQSMISYTWMANKKGAGVVIRGTLYVGTCRFAF